MAASVTVNDREVLLGLGDFQTSIADRRAIYGILGSLMMASIAMTFREEGSPEGSWPKLALSTLRKKGYTAGRKLLYRSGRLFRSIKAVTTGDALVIGTGEGIPYAAVHQFGSADRLGGSVSAQAKLADRAVKVGAYDYSRLLGFGISYEKSKKGRKAAIQGPGKRIHVGEHTRHQNIPARPYLVFRPEDPANMMEALDLYIASHAPAGGVA